MRRDPRFTLQFLHGVPTLLPFGQAVADHRQGVQLDEAGVFLWNALADEPSREELLARFLQFSEVTPEEALQAEQDLDSFLSQLTAFRILTPEAPSGGAACWSVKIAGLRVSLAGDPAWIPQEFAPFREETPGTPDQTITLTDREPVFPRGGELLLRTEELELLRTEDRWVILFPASSQVAQGEVSLDGREAWFFVRPCFTLEETAALREELFHAIRPVFLLRARQWGVFALHGVSLGYRDRAWLFSASSGTGKSTHARLWEESFGVRQLNGDLALLAFRDADGRETPETLWLQPGPWCGTSGIFTTETVPVGGITLLARGTEDWLEALSPDRKQLMLANRLISPFWTREMLEANLAFARQVTDRLPLWRLHCTMDPHAARVMKDEIDRWVEST